MKLSLKVQKYLVRCGVRTHAHSRVPELKSGALDRSANLTLMLKSSFGI